MMNIIAASAILAGEIRLFDNAKSGTKANQFAIDPVTLGSFMGKAKEGLGRQIKLEGLFLLKIQNIINLMIIIVPCIKINYQLLLGSVLVLVELFIHLIR